MSYDMGKGQERRKELLAELDRIVEILKNENIERVILFGSLARGTTRSGSDIDLIVVRNTDKRFLDRVDDIIRLVEPVMGLDVLVYTPKEFELMKHSSSFVRNAIGEGKVLYAKKPT